MIPLKRHTPLTAAVVECFLGLRGQARERAIATGNYDELVREQAQEQRQPGEDALEDIDPLSLASQA